MNEERQPPKKKHSISCFNPVSAAIIVGESEKSNAVESRGGQNNSSSICSGC